MMPSLLSRLRRVLHEPRDVLGAVAERRERHREDAEAVVEIFAEGLVVDSLEQVAVGGGDDPDVAVEQRHAQVALDPHVDERRPC